MHPTHKPSLCQEKVEGQEFADRQIHRQADCSLISGNSTLRRSQPHLTLQTTLTLAQTEDPCRGEDKLRTEKKVTSTWLVPRHPLPSQAFCLRLQSPQLPPGRAGNAVLVTGSHTSLAVKGLCGHTELPKVWGIFLGHCGLPGLTENKYVFFPPSLPPGFLSAGIQLDPSSLSLC